MSVKFVAIKKIDATDEDYVAEFLFGAKRIFVNIVGLRETVIEPASKTAKENRDKLEKMFKNSPDIIIASELLSLSESIYYAVQSALGDIFFELHQDSKNNNLAFRYTWTAGNLTRTL